jgi:hypothetical protein
VTLVTVTPDAIRVYNHAGRTEVCIAVSAAIQLTARILHAGKALESASLEADPPKYEIVAAIGDMADSSIPQDERVRIARQRAGRMAFVQAVFDGFSEQMSEIAAMRPDALEVKDQRHDVRRELLEVMDLGVALERKLIQAG